MTIKWCSNCCKDKGLDEFGKNANRADGLFRICKVCNSAVTKEYKRQAQGIPFSEAQYKAMHTKQKGLCALCERPESIERGGTRYRLAVDHDDQSKRVRALLCSDCNTGIGKLQHDPELLTKAANYILAHRRA